MDEEEVGGPALVLPEVGDPAEAVLPVAPVECAGGSPARVVGKVRARRRSWLPTKQQERYVTHRMMGKGERDAAVAAGYEGTRGQLSRLRNDGNLRAYMSECMAGAGLTPERFAEVLSEGLNARRIVRTQYKGEVVEEFADRDLVTARLYLKMSMGLLGLESGSLTPKEESAGATYVLPNNLEEYTTDQIIEEMRKRRKGREQ